MSRFKPRIKKSEAPDKTPYTIYYPHNIASTERKWTQPYYQVISIDPARKNYAMRIERRYHNGWITPIVFDKVSIESIRQQGDNMICDTYQVLTAFLDKYSKFYEDCHFIVIERQLPDNYQAVRISQHTITYFSMCLHNKPLLPSIVEIDPKLKGRILGAPKGIDKRQLKTWAIEKGRELLTIRKDDFSLQVLNYFRNKQDDLCDTICQSEALFILWGLLPTISPPSIGPDNTPQQIKPITLQLTPSIVISDLDNPLDEIAKLIKPITNPHTSNIQVPIPMASIQHPTNTLNMVVSNNNSNPPKMHLSSATNVETPLMITQLLSLMQPPARVPATSITSNTLNVPNIPNIPSIPGMSNTLTLSVIKK